MARARPIDHLAELADCGALDLTRTVPPDALAGLAAELELAGATVRAYLSELRRQRGIDGNALARLREFPDVGGYVCAGEMDAPSEAVRLAEGVRDCLVTVMECGLAQVEPTPVREALRRLWEVSIDG